MEELWEKTMGDADTFPYIVQEKPGSLQARLVNVQGFKILKTYKGETAWSDAQRDMYDAMFEERYG